MAEAMRLISNWSSSSAGTAGLMGPIGLGLMGFGSILNAFSTYKQGKIAAKQLKRQAAEYERQARFEQEMNLEEQGLMTRESQQAVGAVAAQGAGSNLRVGGSVRNRMMATEFKYEEQKRLSGKESVEKQWQLNTQAYLLRKMAKNVRKASEWGAFADILGGAANVGLGGYEMGLWV